MKTQTQTQTQTQPTNASVKPLSYIESYKKNGRNAKAPFLEDVLFAQRNKTLPKSVRKKLEKNTEKVLLNYKEGIPVVGMGATTSYGSDCYPHYRRSCR